MRSPPASPAPQIAANIEAQTGNRVVIITLRKLQVETDPFAFADKARHNAPRLGRAAPEPRSFQRDYRASHAFNLSSPPFVCGPRVCSIWTTRICARSASRPDAGGDRQLPLRLSASRGLNTWKSHGWNILKQAHTLGAFEDFIDALGAWAAWGAGAGEVVPERSGGQQEGRACLREDDQGGRLLCR